MTAVESIVRRRRRGSDDKKSSSTNGREDTRTMTMKKKAYFMTWKVEDVGHVARHHRVACLAAAGLLFFMAVEYTLSMVPPSSPPFDIGFVATNGLHRLISTSPILNTLLAALNTVFVGMQTVYIIWTFVVEGRSRAVIATLFMFTCRGILGYSTQLPLPEGFVGSGADFPVGNVSFFLFYSGHVAGSVIASLDMRRVNRHKLALIFDTLNVLQVVRLLGTRGHYTIDLAAGLGAGILFDSLAEKYVQWTKTLLPNPTSAATANTNGNDVRVK